MMVDRTDAKADEGEHEHDRSTGPEQARKNRPGKTDQSQDTDERLDQALEETFPSSDPVSVKVTK